MDQGKVDVVSLLLQSGAEVNVEDESKLTPLHLASLGGQLEVVELLLSLDEDARAYVNAKDVDGLTPLHMAAYNGYLQVVELLIRSGAILNSKDNDGNTPLDVALANHHAKIAELLEVEHPLTIPVG